MGGTGRASYGMTPASRSVVASSIWPLHQNGPIAIGCGNHDPPSRREDENSAESNHISNCSNWKVCFKSEAKASKVPGLGVLPPTPISIDDSMSLDPHQ